MDNKKWRVDDEPDTLEGRSYHVFYKKHKSKRKEKLKVIMERVKQIDKELIRLEREIKR